ncbi:MAG: hypothetical protein VYB55_03790 [Bacteroidota bacterium]|nr:hypothetical protein [Bacteroidota bacterium]
MNNIIEKIRALAAKYYNGGGYIGNIMYTVKKGEELKVLQTNTPKLFNRINRKHFERIKICFK